MMRTRHLAAPLALTAVAAIYSITGCESGGRGASPAAIIPGPGTPGFDAALEEKMELFHRQAAVLNSSADGVGESPVTLASFSDTGKIIINRYFTQYPAVESFADFCAQDLVCAGQYTSLMANPQDPSSQGIFQGTDLLSGMHGGTAMVGEFMRYAVLRDSGYPDSLVAAARARVIADLEVLDTANSIAGVPGVMVYKMRRKDAGTPWTGGIPFTIHALPGGVKTGMNREDNSSDQRFLDDWGWIDNFSKDQAEGWLFAMGAAWDTIAGDPAIPQRYKTMLQDHARNFAHRLMEVAPELGTDMVIRDHDGNLTKDCDVNPTVIVMDGCWNASTTLGPSYPFNAIMGLGFIRVCLHITGDQDIRDFYYGQLIDARRWHEFVRDAAFPLADYGYATNYSNVNMAFLAFYNTLRYETDPAVRSVLQQALNKFWDNGQNHRQPKYLHQPLFDVIYDGLRREGHAADIVDGGLDSLRDEVPPVYWAENVINCDQAELSRGWCVAVDNATVIEMPVYHDASLAQNYSTADPCGPRTGLGHNGDTIVAEYVVPRKIRGPSNNDLRSDPFEVNRCGNAYMVEGIPDVLAGYWLGRALAAGTDPGRNISRLARGR